MTCCMNISMNTNLLINNFMEKKKTFNVWLKKRFNQNLPTKLNDKEAIKLEESKYIKKIECKIPKPYIESNIKYDHFNHDLTSKSGCLIDPNEKLGDKSNQFNGQTATEKELKSLEATNQYRSLNQDEWELFFVVDEKAKFNQKSDKSNKNATKSDFNKKELNNDLDLEWDDFNDDFDDELNLVCSEENQLIFEKASK